MIRRPPRSTLSSSSAASDVYKRQVQNSVSHMANFSSRLCPVRRNLGAVEGDIGTNLEQFSETQDGVLAKVCQHTAAHYRRISLMNGEFSLAEAQTFAEVLNYQVGMLAAADEVFDNRKTCALTTQSYQQSCDAAATEYNKYKDNAGKQAKAQKAQQSFQECQTKLQAAEKHYAEFAAALPVELGAFEEARKKEMLKALLENATQSKLYHEQMLAEWDRLERQLHSELGSNF
eukprot:TRINITY_DN20395_c0_g1_i2.p1 TRINITY_DN20395_c0_g1~~TRINITY_DN20395_c0_g1_i2.p1  ORF type:complete len:232 (+),score=78.78 TRINITY_DN20395_c0_g1_i2:83-778(+)